MKSRTSFWYVLLVVFTFIGSLRATAQIEDIGSLIDAGANDANTITRAYLTPLIKGFGTGLNTGWLHSCSPGDFPHFYIGVRSGLAFVPSSDQRFDVTTLKFENLHYMSGPTIAPTANGPDRDGPTMLIMKPHNGTLYEISDLTLPSGSGLNFAPAPVIQAGVGLTHHTSLMLRFVPKITIRDGSAYSFYMDGIGIQHGLNQWLPGGNTLPVDLSVMFGYTLAKGRISLDTTPADDPWITNPYSIDTWNNQHLRIRTTAFTMNLVAGKRLSVFHCYAGLGYETSKTHIIATGNYPTTMPDPLPANQYHERIAMLVDPIDFTVSGFQTMHFFAGTGINLSFFKIFMDFSVAKYATVNFGIGFGS